MLTPRLLYIGDVPVEASSGGALLLHRLLKTYPADRLNVVETSPWNSSPADRISEVAYHTLPFGASRLLHSRAAPLYNVWLHEKAPHVACRIDPLLSGFVPDAVVTVAHWHTYRTAQAYAAARDVPLHLIVHDDMRDLRPVWSPYRPVVTRTMRSVYQAAVRRYCVSPQMVDAYEDEWGTSGTVLYPHRAPDGPVYTSLKPLSSPVTVAYAGGMDGRRAEKLMALADALPGGIELLVFSPLDRASAQAQGYEHPVIDFHPFVSPDKIVDVLRERADVLLATMKFESLNQRIARYSFPSKLTDYTAAGLPIVLWGPNNWSAIAWGQHHGTAEIVTSRQPADAAQAIRTLLDDDERRSRLTQRAIDIGCQYFSHEAATDTFFSGVRDSVSPPAAPFLSASPSL